MYGHLIFFNLDVEGHLEVHEIQTIFNKIASKLDARDSKVLAVSALVFDFIYRQTGEGVKDAVQWINVRNNLTAD